MERRCIISPKTEIGRRRENQDCMSVTPTHYGDLYLVCDGFGPAGAGREAAVSVVRDFPTLLDQCFQKGQTAPEALQDAAQVLNHRLCTQNDQADPNQGRFGCTLVAALQTAAGLWIGHLGDSRAYLFRDNHLQKLTRDHSHLADLIYDQGLSVADALQHPQAGILTQALGSHPEATLTLFPHAIPMDAGDALLLCSDGLCGYVEDEDIAATTVRQNQPAQVADALVDLALEQGSQDNITVVYVAFEVASMQPSPPMPGTPSAPLEPTASPNPANTRAPNGAGPRPQTGGNPPTRSAQQHDRTALILQLSLAVFLMGVLVSVLHLPGRLEIDREQPKTPAPAVAGDSQGPQEFDHPEDFQYQARECPETATGQARGIIGDIEAGMRPATAMSPEAEQQLGAHLAEKMADRYADRLDHNREMTAYLNCIAEELRPHLNQPLPALTIHVIESEEINAFAMPGGHIYLHQGLIRAAVENEAQLAFVLAHEMIHLSERHLVGTEGLLEAWVDGANSLVNSLVGVVKFPFSLSHEREADRLALVLMDQAGYSVFQAVQQMEQMALLEQKTRQNGPTPGREQTQDSSLFGVLQNEAETLFLTHPKSDIRICHLQQLATFLAKDRGPTDYYRGTTNFRRRICRSQEVY